MTNPLPLVIKRLYCSFLSKVDLDLAQKLQYLWGNKQRNFWELNHNWIEAIACFIKYIHNLQDLDPETNEEYPPKIWPQLARSEYTAVIFAFVVASTAYCRRRVYAKIDFGIGSRLFGYTDNLNWIQSYTYKLKFKILYTQFWMKLQLF